MDVQKVAKFIVIILAKTLAKIAVVAIIPTNNQQCFIA